MANNRKSASPVEKSASPVEILECLRDSVKEKEGIRLRGADLANIAKGLGITKPRIEDAVKAWCDDPCNDGLHPRVSLGHLTDTNVFFDGLLDWGSLDTLITDKKWAKGLMDLIEKMHDKGDLVKLKKAANTDPRVTDRPDALFTTAKRAESEGWAYHQSAAHYRQQFKVGGPIVMG